MDQGIETTIYKGYPIRVYNKERMLIELLRYKSKLPSEQELQFNIGTGNHSVMILLPENIRIEIGADCPARLMMGLMEN